MIVTIVEVCVNQENINDFISACAKNHEASIQEPGNRRFDVLQSPSNESQFILYEAYHSEKEATAHKQTAHYLQWRETVAPWMATPRKGNPYKALYPHS